MLSKKKVVCG